MGMISNVIEFLETGYTPEQIAELTGYPIDVIRKTAESWRNNIKTK